jgi:cellulose synthase (UDP-forming)
MTIQPTVNARTSLVKTVAFAAAILANICYLVFLLNPAHAGNLAFYVLTAIADTIAIVILVATWVTCLHFEIYRHRYYREIADLRQRGQSLATVPVAVLVPVVNEDLALIRYTVECLLAMTGDKRVYVLDDGRRAATHDLCQRLGVHYVTRDDSRFHKAGNLAHGLRYVREEFVLVVDADFAVRPDFLARTLPLFADPSVAAVQTPQVYGNQDTLFSQGSIDLQSLFYSYLQPGKHLLNSAFCVGTNVVYRKAALDEIGGIPRMNDSEDIYTSLQFAERGWSTFYLNEPLAVGLAPSSLIAFFNQQFRWARGGLRMLLRDNPLFNRRLRADQRLQFFVSNIFYLSGVAVLVYLVSPLIAALFGIAPVASQFSAQWVLWYGLFLVTNVGLYLALVRRNRWQSLALALFSFVPYTAALIATVLRFQGNWKPTNARSTGLITKILAPLIIYLAMIAIAGYLIFANVVMPEAAEVIYYFWLALDVVVILPFVIASYAARPKQAIPSFEEHRVRRQRTARPRTANATPAPAWASAHEYRRSARDTAGG